MTVESLGYPDFYRGDAITIKCNTTDSILLNTTSLQNIDGDDAIFSCAEMNISFNGLKNLEISPLMPKICQFAPITPEAIMNETRTFVTTYNATITDKWVDIGLICRSSMLTPSGYQVNKIEYESDTKIDVPNVLKGKFPIYDHHMLFWFQEPDFSME